LVILKIYRVKNKGRESFTLSYHAADKRVFKMFASLDEAICESSQGLSEPAQGRFQLPGADGNDGTASGL
jgi:hypothetical protein